MRCAAVTVCLSKVCCFFSQRAKVLKQKKEEGNEAFRRGRLQDAHTLYSAALEIDPQNVFTNSKLYNNRATVLSKVSACWLVRRANTLWEKYLFLC